MCPVRSDLPRCSLRLSVTATCCLRESSDARRLGSSSLSSEPRTPRRSLSSRWTLQIRTRCSSTDLCHTNTQQTAKSDCCLTTTMCPSMHLANKYNWGRSFLSNKKTNYYRNTIYRVNSSVCNKKLKCLSLNRSHDWITGLTSGQISLHIILSWLRHFRMTKKQSLSSKWFGMITSQNCFPKYQASERTSICFTMNLLCRKKEVQWLLLLIICAGFLRKLNTWDGISALICKCFMWYSIFS